MIAENTGSTSIFVGWEPPLTPRGIIIYYTLSYYTTIEGDDSTERSAETVLTSGTDVEVTGLMKYTQYSVYVEASTVAGVGERSKTVTVYTDEDSEFEKTV